MLSGEKSLCWNKTVGESHSTFHKRKRCVHRRPPLKLRTYNQDTVPSLSCTCFQFSNSPKLPMSRAVHMPLDVPFFTNHLPRLFSLTLLYSFTLLSKKGIENRSHNHHHGRFRYKAVCRRYPQSSPSLYLRKALTMYLLAKSLRPYCCPIEQNRLRLTH